MNYRDSDKERFLKTLRWEATDRVPNLETLYESNHVDAILQKKTGKSSWELSPADQVELAMRTGIDMLFMGGYGKFGQHNKLMEDGSYQYYDGEIKNKTEFDSYDFKTESREKLSVFEHQLKALCEGVQGTKVGVAVAFRSVFSDTALSMGLTDFMINLYDDPGFVGAMMDVYLDFAMQVISIIQKYPVDLVLIDDDLADSNGIMIGVQRIKELWLPRTKLITEKLGKLGIPYIGHCCGKVEEVVPLFIELGCSGIHPIQPSCNDIYKLKETYHKQIAFIGNIDILDTLSLGTPDKVKQDVTEHIERLSKESGYVLSSSHTMVNSIPVNNYKVMLQTLHEVCNTGMTETSQETIQE